MAEFRRLWRSGGRQLLIGFGVGSLIVLLALALWPHSGVSGNVSAWVCVPSQNGAQRCSVQPATASITIDRLKTPGPFASPPASTWSLKTDTHGHFRVDLPAGAYTLLAQSPDSQGGSAFPVFDGQVTTVPVLMIRVISMGICLPSTDRISTPAGPIPIDQLRVGAMVWTGDDGGHRVAAPIVMIRHVPTPPGFHVIRLTLEDGRVVEASAGHPTTNSRLVGELKLGDSLDGSRIVAIGQVSYSGETWDILPQSTSGAYWANGVLLGSTLLPG